MIRTLLAVVPAGIVFIALALCPTSTAAEDRPQLDADPTLFTVMAAINASGYDADIDSPANHPLRKAVREYLNKQNVPSLADLKVFFKAHELPDPAANLAQYISYAL